MKIVGYITNVGTPFEGTTKEGKSWKRVPITFTVPHNTDTRMANELILADVWNDKVPEDTLRQVLRDGKKVELSLWFSLREYVFKDEARITQVCTVDSVSIPL